MGFVAQLTAQLYKQDDL